MNYNITKKKLSLKTNEMLCHEESSFFGFLFNDKFCAMGFSTGNENNYPK